MPLAGPGTVSGSPAMCLHAGSLGELSVQGRGRLPLLVLIVLSLDGGLAGSHFCSWCCNSVLLAAVYVLTASEVLNTLPSVVRYDLGNGLC